MIEAYKGPLGIAAVALLALGILSTVLYCEDNNVVVDKGQAASPPINHPDPNDDAMLLAGPGGVRQAMDAGLGSDNGTPSADSAADAQSIGDAVLDGFCSVNYCPLPR